MFGMLWLPILLSVVGAATDTQYFHEIIDFSGNCDNCSQSLNSMIGPCYSTCDSTGGCLSFKIFLGNKSEHHFVARRTVWKSSLNCSGPSESIPFYDNNCTVDPSTGFSHEAFIDTSLNVTNCTENTDESFFAGPYAHVMIFSDTNCSHCSISINYQMERCFHVARNNGSRNAISDPNGGVRIRNYTSSDCTGVPDQDDLYQLGNCHVFGSQSSMFLRTAGKLPMDNCDDNVNFGNDGTTNSNGGSSAAALVFPSLILVVGLIISAIKL